LLDVKPFVMTTPSTQGWKQSKILSVILHLSISVGGLIIARLLTTITQMVLARRMGLEDFGVYSTVYTLLGPAIMVASLGLDTWLLRQSHDTQSFSHYISEVIWLRIFSTVLCMALSIPFVLIKGDDSITLGITVLAAFGLFFELLLTTSHTILRSQLRNYAAAMLQVLVAALLILMIWYLWDAQTPVLTVSAYRAITGLVGVAVMVWLLRQNLQFVWNPKQFWHIIKDARLYFASDLLSNATSKADLTIISLFLGAVANGTYNPALTIINTTFLIPTVFWQVFLPILARQEVGSRSFRKMMLLHVVTNALYGICCSIVIYFGAHQIIDLLYTSEFLASADLLQIMSLIPLVKSFNFCLAIYMVVRDKQGLRAVLLAISAIINIIANLIAIPLFGLEGAAWVNLITEFITFICYAYGAWVAKRRPHEHSVA
jgi:O-antigen/teichoic acid export membrane protein